MVSTYSKSVQTVVYKDSESRLSIFTVLLVLVMPRNSQLHSSELEMHGAHPGHSDATAARRETIRNPVLASGRSPSDPSNAPFTGRTLNPTDYKAVSDSILL